MYCCMGDMIYQRGQCVLLYGRYDLSKRTVCTVAWEI